MKKKLLGASIIIALAWCPLANAQQPVLLIHGFGEDEHIWDSWITWLKDDHFNMTRVLVVTFSSNDQCGSVKQHVPELANQVNSMLKATHAGKVNIVAHSAGGLDARWYIAHTNVDRVANLVMIGTPNAGTAAAYVDLTSCAFAGSSSLAGLEDLQPDSQATQVTDRTQTNYYTIAGTYPIPCLFVGGFISTCYLLPNDGLVTVSSAQSSYPQLGVFPYNHTGLVTHKDVYEKVISILASQ